MKIKDFLYNRLKELSQKFPGVSIKYAFDPLADAHIVEITPKEQYYNNPALDDAWMNIAGYILTNYPNDMVSFVSDDSSLAISQPEFIFENKDHVKDIIKDIFGRVFSDMSNYNVAFTQSFSQPAHHALNVCNVHWRANTVSEASLAADTTVLVNSEYLKDQFGKPLAEAGEYSYAMAA